MKKLNFIVAIIFAGSMNSLMASDEKIIEFSIIDAAGNFAAAGIDNDMDGISASYSTLHGKSKELKSSITANILSEAKPKFDEAGMPVFCQTPDGQTGVELGLVKARGDYRLKNGDHFFTEAISLQACANLTTCFDDSGRIKEGCKTHTVVAGKIIGGTGRFACANGEFEDESTGLALVVDPKGDVFGSILASSVRGTIRIPRNCSS